MISPNVVTFTSALKAYCGGKVFITDVFELHKGFDRNLYVRSNVGLYIYNKSGLSIEGEKSLSYASSLRYCIMDWIDCRVCRTWTYGRSVDMLFPNAIG